MGHALKVTTSRGGTVRSVPQGLIDCGGNCSAELSLGVVVTLRPTPMPDWVFKAWEGDCRGRLACRVRLTDDREVVAIFVPRSRPPAGTSKLIVSVATDIGIVRVEGPFGVADCRTMSCEYDVPSGSRVTLRARPRFAGDKLDVSWSGACGGDAAGCAFEVQGKELARVGFSTPLETWQGVNVTRSGSGTIESDPDGISCPSRCSAAFPKGKTVLLTAKPSSSRFVLKHWYGNCTGNQLCSLTPGNATVYISAVFGPAMDELRVSKSGDGTGTVTSVPSGIDCGAICAHSFERGTAVVLEAQPEAASRFAGWSGDCSGRGVCRVTLQRDTSVTARFERIRDEVRVVKTGPGVGLVTSRPAGVSCGDTCVAAFARGTRVELTSIPDRSSRFGGWGGGCTGKKRVHAHAGRPRSGASRFERIQDELRVQKGGTGRGYVKSTPPGIACGTSCMAPFPHGTTVALRAMPDAGSRFVRWGGRCSGTLGCTVRMSGPGSCRGAVRTRSARLDRPLGLPSPRRGSLDACLFTSGFRARHPPACGFGAGRSRSQRRRSRRSGRERECCA